MKITNILGFFISSYDHGTVTGYLINKKELYKSGHGGVAGQASFLRQIMLIR